MRPRIALLFLLVCSLALLSAHTTAAAEGSFQRTLTVNGATNLDIETGSGSIQVRAGSSDKVEIHGRIRATNWFGGSSAEERVRKLEANPPIQQNGNDIRLGHVEDAELRRNISISYEVVVPADTRLRSRTGSGGQTVEGIKGPVDLQTGSGDLNFSNIGNTVRAESGSGGIEASHVNGSVRAKSGSGSIRATEVAGGFDGETGSGDITLTQTAAGSVRAETGSGSIDLRGVRGSLQGTSGSGSIHAEGDPKGAWNLHTGSGSVRVHFPSDASFDLYAHTGSGGVTVNQPITVQGSLGRKEVRGKVRNGGVPVEIETGSGSIDIE